MFKSLTEIPFLESVFKNWRLHSLVNQSEMVNEMDWLDLPDEHPIPQKMSSTLLCCTCKW